MANNIGIVYKVTSLSGKVYIGKTVQSLKNRMNRHLRDAFNRNLNTYDTKFYKAIRKYNKELKWEILCEVDIVELNDLEKTYISKYNSFLDGYNSTLGGDGVFGKILSEEHKTKISQANSGINHPLYGKSPWNKGRKGLQIAWNKGKSLSASHKEKLEKNRFSWLGKIHSEETKLKMSEARKKYWENRRSGQ